MFKEEPSFQLRAENANKKHENVFIVIDRGQIKLPMFQRDFVWEKEQSVKFSAECVNDFATPCFINLRCRVVLFQSVSFGLAVG